MFLVQWISNCFDNNELFRKKDAIEPKLYTDFLNKFKIGKVLPPFAVMYLGRENS